VNRVIGLDLGTRTCGIAISDTLGIAHGYENYRFTDSAYKQAIAHVIEVLHLEKVNEVALGYPLNMDGSAGERAESCARFKEELLAVDPSLKITLVDERMTTMIATKRLLEADLSRNKRHQVIDQQSAVVILESYLEAKENSHD
jgi:putative holliday junction resolvase